MNLIKKNHLYNNYYFQSKYSMNNIVDYPKILMLEFKTLVFLKNKKKLCLFLNIIHLLIFNKKIRSVFIYKNTNINIMFTKIRSQYQVYLFLNNFIFIYLPLIHSFSTESKYQIKKQRITFYFLKFPLILELNAIFLTIENVVIFMNNYKFQVQLFLTANKNQTKNFTLLHQLKLPLIE